MPHPAFLPSVSLLRSAHVMPHARAATPLMCTARPPNDPSKLRTESQRRRNSPPKPMRRRRRGPRTDEPIVDWQALPSVPLVRPDASPESGEDYWVDLNPDQQLRDPDMGKGLVKKRRPARPINARLKSKLKEEVVSPWKDNWILWIAVVVLVLVLLVAAFGGLDTVPIISVPDL